MFPPKTTKYGFEYDKVCPYRRPGVFPTTLMVFHVPIPSLISSKYKSSDANPPEPVAPP